MLGQHVPVSNIGVLVWVLAALLSVQIPASIPRKAGKDDSSPWPVSHRWEARKEFEASVWFWPGQDLVGLHWLSGRSFLLCLPLSCRSPFKQLRKNERIACWGRHLAQLLSCHLRHSHALSRVFDSGSCLFASNLVLYCHNICRAAGGGSGRG